MHDIFGFLILIFFIALIVGLIKPSLFATSMPNPTRKKVGLLLGGLVFIFFIGFGVTTPKTDTSKPEKNPVQEQTINDKPTQKVTATNKPQQKAKQELNVKTESYQSYDGKTYKFEIINKPGDEKTMASFTPFIPNKDSNLVEAILRVFIAQYGADAQINPTPSLEARNGVNLIKFQSDKGYYYVSPIKQDTGEIHSIVFWKE